MLLYQSSLFILDYDPATDILSLDWPDVKEFLVPAASQEVSVLIDSIKHYDVKKLLIDTSKAKVDVASSEYQKFISEFAQDLKSTRLQKFARVATTDPEREKMAEIARQTTNINETIEFRNFASKDEARAWLLS